jgi:hypothetical protein
VLRNVSDLPSFSLALRTASGAVPNGAVVEVDYAGFDLPVEIVVGAGGATRFACASDTAFVGWQEDNPPQAVRVRWPSGGVQALAEVPEAGRAYVVRER